MMTWWTIRTFLTFVIWWRCAKIIQHLGEKRKLISSSNTYCICIFWLLNMSNWPGRDKNRHRQPMLHRLCTTGYWRQWSRNNNVSGILDHWEHLSPWWVSHRCTWFPAAVVLLTAVSRRQNCAVGVDVGGDRNSSKQHRGPAPDILHHNAATRVPHFVWSPKVKTWRVILWLLPNIS